MCDLIFISHVQHIIHDMHNIIHWSQESRRLDFVWAEWVPNTFSFRNLAKLCIRHASYNTHKLANENICIEQQMKIAKRKCKVIKKYTKENNC